MLAHGPEPNPDLRADPVAIRLGLIGEKILWWNAQSNLFDLCINFPRQLPGGVSVESFFPSPELKLLKARVQKSPSMSPRRFLTHVGKYCFEWRNARWVFPVHC